MKQGFLIFFSALCAFAVCQAVSAPLEGAKPLGLPREAPPNEASVTALAVGKGDVIFGATSGDAVHIFAYEPAKQAFTHIDKLPAGMVQRSLCVDSDGSLWVGTMPTEQWQEEVAEMYRILSSTQAKKPFKQEDLDAQLGAFEGRIYHYIQTAPLKFRRELYPVQPGSQGIYCMTIDPARRKIYGVTYPYGLLFRLDLARPSWASVGKVGAPAPYEMQPRLPKALILDGQGNLYTSTTRAARGSQRAAGVMAKYEAAADRLMALDDAVLPAVYGREPWATVDALTWGGDGRLIGGTSDGYLFSFDPGTGALTKYGKPSRQQGMQGLARGRDGRIYGVAGEPEGIPRPFSFDPATKGLEFGPPVGGNISTPFGDMVADAKGNIYLGKTGRLGGLFVAQ